MLIVKINQREKINEFNIITSSEPPIKLLKYGNSENNPIEIINNNHYKNVLPYNFQNEKFISLGKELIGQEFNEDICIYIEIFSTFKLSLNKNTKIYSNSNSNLSKFSDVIINNKISDYDTIFLQCDKSYYMTHYINLLSKLLNLQKLNSNLIIEIGPFHSNITCELINFLSSYYELSYLFKPTIISPIKDSFYLICLNLKNTFNIPEINIQDLYIISISLCSQEINDLIQKLLIKYIPIKIEYYMKIKKYVDNKNFHGAQTEELLQEQLNNLRNWYKLFYLKENLDEFMKSSLEET